MKKILSLVVIAFSMSSCATIFTGTKSTLQINSNPTGAKIIVNGIDRGKTPCAITLKRGFNGETITLKKEGFEPKIFEPEQSFQAVSCLNLFNILFWGIDAATGAIKKYDPKFYELELEPQKESKK